MPTLVNYSGKDELCNERAFYPNSMANMGVFGSACKRARITAPFVLWGRESEQAKRSSISVLHDECLFEIFRRMPAQERSNAACVSKHWLNLVSRIRRTEMCNNDTAMVSDDNEVDGCLTRSVEGKKATDIRLAAIAVGTAARGGLGKLSIRGSNSSHGVTNVGLSAIARGCPSLKSLSLWNVSSIGDEGLSEIAKECHMLEKLDLSQCPSITNKGLIAIAENCPNLTTLSIEFCPNIGNESMQALAQGCPKLESLSIKDCPLVGDRGIASLFSSNSSILAKVKLQNLNISGFSLAVIGHYGKFLTSLTLSNLKNVTEQGFCVMGSAQGLKALVSLSISSCLGVTDSSIGAIGMGCSVLKHIYLRDGCFMSDNGLFAFSKSAISLESMHLEDCNRITLPGLIAALCSCSFKFRSLSLVRCMSHKDVSFVPPLLLYPCISLRCLSIKNCPAFGSAGLSIMTKMCPSLKQVDLSGLYGMSDEGILSLLEGSVTGLVKLNLSGCINLSDESVLAVARLHGETIKVLNLDGCRKITDMSLMVIAGSCPLLSELDVSKSAVTDSGIAALATSSGQLNLQILSISGCARISNKSLPYLILLGKSLVGLNLQHCNSLSSSGVDKLMGSLWRCDILC